MKGKNFEMLLTCIRQRFIENGIYLGEDESGNGEIKFYAYKNNLYAGGYTYTGRYVILKTSKKRIQKALKKKGLYYLNKNICRNMKTLTAILHHFEIFEINNEYTIWHENR